MTIKRGTPSNNTLPSNPKPLYYAILLTFLSSTAPFFTSPAVAACVSGKQCKIDDGSTSARSKQDFQAKGNQSDDAALVVNHGSTFSGTQLGLSAKQGYATGVDVSRASHLTLNDSTVEANGVALSYSGKSHVTLNNVNLTTHSNTSSALQGHGTNTLIMNGGSLTSNSYGITTGSGVVRLDGTKIVAGQRYSAPALLALANRPVSVDVHAKNFDFRTTFTSAVGVQVDANAVVTLEDGFIKTEGQFAHGIWVVNHGDYAQPLAARRVTIETTGFNAHGIDARAGTTTLIDSKIRVNRAFGLTVSNSAGFTPVHAPRIVMHGGSIDVYKKNGVAAATQNTASLVLDKVAIHTHADATTGLFFRGDKTHINSIELNQTQIQASHPSSVIVLADGGTNTLHASNSMMTGDQLILARQDSNLAVNASASQMTGHASITKAARLSMNLVNHSIWTLKPSSADLRHSHVSFLSLNNSAIQFDAATPYQTLIVGSGDTGGKPLVYQAGSNSRIVINTLLNAGGSIDQQFTDRVLINGDVSGTTRLVVNPVQGSLGAATSPTGDRRADEGISLVQVSGKAQADAFVLDGSYATLSGQPWRYGLYAYGPESSHGLADDTQRLVSGTDPHWDWRLQSEFLGSTGGTTRILAPRPVPQVANYLTAATALFQSGLMDVTLLHQRLGLASQIDASAEQRNANEFFLRSYGGDYDYRSDRTFNEYGYGASIRYTAAQIGATTSVASSTRVGLAANYGELRLTPRNEPDAKRTRLHTWSVVPTLNWRHDASGTYVGALLAYGRFRGEVATRLRAQTATLKGSRNTASIETGLPLVVGDVMVVPQAQVTYQRLRFARVRDADGFNVSLGSPRQWTFKAGAELRTQFDTGKGSTVRLHGKTTFAQHHNSHQQVWLGEDFTLGKSGTTLENGVGLDAVFAKGMVTAFVDLRRQHRLSRAGNQGWGANIGANVLF